MSRLTELVCESVGKRLAAAALDSYRKPSPWQVCNDLAAEGFSSLGAPAGARPYYIKSMPKGFSIISDPPVPGAKRVRWPPHFETNEKLLALWYETAKLLADPHCVATLLAQANVWAPLESKAHLARAYALTWPPVLCGDKLAEFVSLVEAFQSGSAKDETHLGQAKRIRDWLKKPLWRW